MRESACHRLNWLVLVAGLGFFTAAPTSVGAQDPQLIPGLPAMGLQSGERPPRTAGSPAHPIDTDAETRPEESESPPPEPPPFGLTGDWFGARSSLVDRGLDLRTNVTQFYQGITAGGLQQGFDYGGKLDYFGTADAEKLLGWQGLFVNLHGETRFGQSINDNVGSLVPANFALEFPHPKGTATALTNVQVEQFVTPDLVVTFGKLNAADGVNIHPFLGGNGIDRFSNEAFVLNPIYGRTIPYSTLGAGFSYLHESDPILTFLVLDSTGQPGTSGLANMFSNGATLFAHLRIPVTPFGLLGHQSLEGAYTSAKSSPLSPDDYVILDVPTVPAIQRTGSWVLGYGFDQFLFVDPENPNKGWGIFGSANFADQRTNPLASVWLIGAGGTSPLPGRSADSFGAAYYFAGVSGVLHSLLQPVAPIGNEQGVELFYNVRVTAWFTLTADFQVIEPAQADASTAVVVGLRGKIAL